MQPKTNLAGRVGRWSARHRRIAIAGWLAFVVLAFVLGGSAGTRTLDYAETGVGESGRADRALHHAFPKRAEEGVYVHSRTATATDPAFTAVLQDVDRRLKSTPGVRDLQPPVIAPDGRSALIGYELRGDERATTAAVDTAVAAIEGAASAHRDFEVKAFGDASSNKELQGVINGDLHRAELISLPITLLILLVAFGGLLVAGAPVLLALSAVLATFGLIGPISRLAPVSDSINSVVLLIGLAVGVDYALFYVRRVREERAAGRGRTAAIEAAAATSGRAVLISGLTVVTAMSGMFFAGAADFTSWAVGTIAVVTLAMAGSLTVLPALLSSMGDRVDSTGGPVRRRLKAAAGRVRLSARVSDAVLRRPKRSLVAATALLVALALPALQMKTATPGPASLPQNLEVVKTFNAVTSAFPSETSAAVVAVEAEDMTGAQAQIDRFSDRVAADRATFPGPVEVDVAPNGTVARLTVPTAGDGFDAASRHALDVLRDDIIPATFTTATASVTGPAATTRDFNASMAAHLPYVVAFVLAATFLLLLVTFRSIVVPIKAIALNLLSVGASYGVLVAVFQGTWAERLLGFHSTGAITPWLPLFLFVILFGLSMDYHVFILSRVREAVDRGLSTEAAVSHGIRSTAGVVTSAAIVMVAVFSIFATLSLLEFKQMGVGLAVAVLLDATLIRGVVLPAAMTLLGERNWWLPRALGRTPALARA